MSERLLRLQHKPRPPRHELARNARALVFWLARDTSLLPAYREILALAGYDEFWIDNFAYYTETRDFDGTGMAMDDLGNMAFTIVQHMTGFLWIVHDEIPERRKRWRLP